MRMPGIARPPLPEHLEAIRQAINSLPDHERSALDSALWGDTIRRNDARNQAAHEAFEAEVKRRLRDEKRRPDPRQLRLDGAA